MLVIRSVCHPNCCGVPPTKRSFRNDDAGLRRERTRPSRGQDNHVYLQTPVYETLNWPLRLHDLQITPRSTVYSINRPCNNERKITYTVVQSVPRWPKYFHSSSRHENQRRNKLTPNGANIKRELKFSSRSYRLKPQRHLSVLLSIFYYRQY